MVPPKGGPRVQLVECIPNVSEGLRAETIDILAERLADDPRVRLLHRHADPDHNRTVFTMVGEPEAVLAALGRLYAAALDAIDMRVHRGAHPRLGAVDVCPFVPLPRHGTVMADCVVLARRLGETVAARFDLPVFLYREAATEGHRRDLSIIRRGQFEGLADKLAEPRWRPDFGPATPHASGGATVIGARGPLIAYNMVLDTDAVAIARRVAAAVRASSGGLAGIKALGVMLASRGLAQVSMNIEDPQATPLEVASDAVERAAAACGVRVRETELVGLISRAAATPGALRWLSRGDFTEALILENAIEASGIASAR
jgi:glutamate formiminotransferase